MRGFLLFLCGFAIAAAQPQPIEWPAQNMETRPWAYWWWMGSAVDKENLTREMQRYRDAGMGGVHIIPIYGAKGYEPRFIEYLSPKWMEMLGHAVKEGERLGLGVDMTTGSGWCFGGPNVTERDACAAVAVDRFDVAAGGRVEARFDRRSTQALAAFSSNGEKVDLTGRIGADGRVDWTAGEGSWQVYAVSQSLCRTPVKRAAPGGAGPMLNPFSGEAMRHYLERFTRAFSGPAAKPRAMYHDSFEYQANWSPALFDEFERRRGYKLQLELPALFGEETADRAARVKSDYRETLSDLMIEEFILAWTGWCRLQGIRTRNQAHGSPGNLLDLYAAADIPETEMFHGDRSTIVSKMASSAAHAAGRRLVASETGTWLKEHFNETLADLKDLADQLFAAGVNHIVYHGTCYSPDDAPWPGWLFYASTQMNPRNPFWRDVPALNAYVSRVQSVLQSGRPANDVLLYWPIYDLWHDAKGRNINLTVHRRDWLEQQPVGSAAQRLLKRGYRFDFVSDRQLAAAQARGGQVVMPGGSYRAIAVPACERMPLATLEKLNELAGAGAAVVFERGLPTDVPGLNRLEERRARLKTLLGLLQPRIRTGSFEATLPAAGAQREPLADVPGLEFIRRDSGNGHWYFISNRGAEAKALDAWVPLAVRASSVAIMDPMTGRAGVGQWRRGKDGGTEVRLALEPGESVVLQTSAGGKFNGPRWRYWQASGRPVGVAGTWQVTAVEGGPGLPGGFETAELGSWAGRGGAWESFGGTARYSITFDGGSAAAGAVWIDLGQVRESARVRLNGEDLGTVFMAPYRVKAEGLRRSGNRLEVEVTNLAANRIRDLDRRKVVWRNFYDINLVNINYKPFDASGWPVRDSGLLGPVSMIPIRADPGR
jgi:hypothetical protein